MMMGSRPSIQTSGQKGHRCFGCVPKFAAGDCFPKMHSVSPPCPNCWRQLSISSLRGRLLIFQGRCEPCQVANEACVRKANAEACVRCQEKHIQHECVGFSHENETELQPKKECGRCGVPKSRNLTSHKLDCIGRCHECQAQGIACEGTVPRGDRRDGCKYCKKKGKTCGDFSHQEDVDARRRKKCHRCDVDGLILKGHLSKCPGKCLDCDKAGEPCDRDQGVNKPCKRCRESTPPIECGQGLQADTVKMKACLKCGRKYPPHPSLK